MPNSLWVFDQVGRPNVGPAGEVLLAKRVELVLDVVGVGTLSLAPRLVSQS